MKIKVQGYESPYVLRALAALLTTLADEPELQKGYPSRDGSVRTEDTVPGEPSETLAESIEARSSRVETGIAPAIWPEHMLLAVEVAEPDYSAAGGYTPPPPPAPVANAASFDAAHGLPPLPPATQVTDKTGTPWDARIHSSSRALVANGTWRLKKGVDKTLVESVQRGLRESERAVPQPPSTVNPAPHAAASTVQTTHVGVAGVVPPPPLPFNEISRFFAVHCMAGKLTHADMEAMAKHSGVEYTQDLMTAANADKRPAALAYLQSLVDSRTPVNA